MTGENGFAGVVEGSIRSDTVTASRFAALQARGYEVLLLDRAKHVIHVSDGIALQPLDAIDGSGFEPPMPVQDTERALSRLRLLRGVLVDGGDGYAASADLASGWQLLVVVPRRLLVAEVRAKIVAPMVLLLIFVFGVMTASWLQMNALQAGIRGLLQTLQGFALGGTLPRQHARGMPRELQPIVAGIDQLGDRLNAAYTELKQAMDRQSELAASLRTVVATRERQIEARTEELRNSVGTRSAYLRSGNCVPYRHARA